MGTWPVIGHEWAIELLAGALRAGQLRHAYLFTGPEGVGKTSLARALAQALLCEGEDRPCGECRACRRVLAGVHPDLRLVEPQAGTLRVDQVRDVTREASRRPLEGRYRVFILAQMEKAHPAAANALLKTLEEPPGHVVLVLTAPAEDVILPTLVSRCQILNLRPVPEDTLTSALVHWWGEEEARARLLARLAGGKPGWALRAREDAAFWKRRADALDLVDVLVQERGHWTRLQAAEKLAAADPDRRDETLQFWQSLYRDILLVQEGHPDAVRNIDFLDQVRGLAGQLEKAGVVAFLRRLLTTQQYLRSNINARLALDVLLLHVPTVKERTHTTPVR